MLSGETAKTPLVLHSETGEESPCKTKYCGAEQMVKARPGKTSVGLTGRAVFLRILFLPTAAADHATAKRYQKVRITIC